MAKQPPESAVLGRAMSLHEWLRKAIPDDTNLTAGDEQFTVFDEVRKVLLEADLGLNDGRFTGKQVCDSAALLCHPPPSLRSAGARPVPHHPCGEHTDGKKSVIQQAVGGPRDAITSGVNCDCRQRDMMSLVRVIGIGSSASRSGWMKQ